VALASVLLPASMLLDAREVAAQSIGPDEARAHIGETVTVDGEVPTVVCSPLACLLSFETDFSGLVASISGDVIDRFPPPKETYSGRRVRVRGAVVDRNGKPRIELSDPADIQLLDGSGMRSAVTSPASAPVRVTVSPPLTAEDGAIDDQMDEPSAQQPVEIPPPPVVPTEPAPPDAARSRVIDPGRVTTRLGGPREPAAAPSGDSVIASLSGGPGDAAAVEARALQQQIDKLQQENANLSATVEALEERLATIEQGGVRAYQGVDEESLPHLPEYVVSGASAKRLQHIKRGWSSERVLRQIGPPLNTRTEANGYMTWYYADGRAVTLDPRGRVSSSIGF